jgi:EpsI family protein
MHVAHYFANQPAVKLAGGSNVLFEPPWWLLADGDVPFTFDGRSFDVRETAIRSPRASLLVWSWYSVRGTPTASDYAAKFLLARATLLRKPEESLAIAIATEDGGDRARATLQDFVEHLSFRAKE